MHAQKTRFRAPAAKSRRFRGRLPLMEHDVNDMTRRMPTAPKILCHIRRAPWLRALLLALYAIMTPSAKFRGVARSRDEAEARLMTAAPLLMASTVFRPCSFFCGGGKQLEVTIQIAPHTSG